MSLDTPILLYMYRGLVYKFMHDMLSHPLRFGNYDEDEVLRDAKAAQAPHMGVC